MSKREPLEWESVDPGLTVYGKLYTAHRDYKKQGKPRRVSGSTLREFVKREPIFDRVNRMIYDDVGLRHLIDNWATGHGQYLSGLERSFEKKDENYQELRVLTDPMRAALRGAFGPTVRLYRSQDKGPHETKRLLHSFSTYSTHRGWYIKGKSDFYVVDVPVEKILFAFSTFDPSVHGPSDYDEFIVEADVLEGKRPIMNPRER